MPGEDDMRITFVQQPKPEDFRSLAAHLVAVPQPQMHSSLWPRRAQVADRLCLMGQEPGREAHRAAYHALRVLVW